MNRMSLFSSSSVVSSMWLFAHSSFTDFPAKFIGMNIFTLLSRSILDGLQGGLAFGVMHSISSKVHLLMHVIQMVNLFLGFALYLFDLINVGCVGGHAGLGCVFS